MRHALLILAISCAALAQSNNFRPTLVQSNTIAVQGCGSNCPILFLDNVTAGNVLFLSFSHISGPVSPSDTISTSYSMSGVITNGPDGSGGIAEIQVGCGIAPNSGANTVTVAAQSAVDIATIMEISGLGTCTTDGSATANAALSGSPAGSLTASPTTSNSNDVCITYGANWWRTSNMWSNGNTAGGDGLDVANLLDYRISGAAGTQSITFNLNLLSSSPGNAWLIHSRCYTPTLAVATDALPHAAQLTAYTAQLQSVGGTGSSRTWNVVSGALPSGISLSSSGAFSGSPTGAVGTNPFKVQVSDGTHTATQNLSIGVGAAFATPAIVGHAIFQAGQITYSATAGNLLLIGFWGQETSGSTIWTPTFTGTNNKLSATPALSFQRIYFLTGVGGNNLGANGAPFSVYAACIPTTSSYTIGFQNTSNTNNVSTFQANIDAVEVSGVQGTIDDSFTPATLAGFASSPGTVTVSGSTVVPNTMAMLFGANGSSVNSPFTLIDASQVSSEALLASYDLAASAGSLSGTMNSTCGTNCNQLALSAEIIPLRPDISGLKCGQNPSGAGSNPPIRHKAQVY